MKEMTNATVNENRSKVILIGIKGDQISMVYVFACSCELRTNYKDYFSIVNKCRSHMKPELVNLIDNIKDWTKVPMLV